MPRAEAARTRLGHSSHSVSNSAGGRTASSTRAQTGGKSTGKYRRTSSRVSLPAATAWPVEVVVVTTNAAAGQRSRQACMKRAATFTSPTLTA